MKETTDVWFTAFLVKNDFEIKSYTVISRGKSKFFFEIDDEKWRELKLSFHNDEISKYKQIIDNLKDLGY